MAYGRPVVATAVGGLVDVTERPRPARRRGAAARGARGAARRRRLARASRRRRRARRRGSSSLRRWQRGRSPPSTSRMRRDDSKTRLDYGHRRPGRVAVGGVSPRAGLRGLRRRPPRCVRVLSEPRRRPTTRIELIQADLLDELSLVGRLRPPSRTRSTTSRRRPSCRCRGRSPSTAEFAAVGATALLEAVRLAAPAPGSTRPRRVRFSAIRWRSPQTEDTPIMPVTPYGAAKAYSFFIVRSYRRRYGLHASSGILYNHESPRRPLDFLPARSRTEPPGSRSGSRRPPTRQTSTPGGTGATRATMCARWR